MRRLLSNLRQSPDTEFGRLLRELTHHAAEVAALAIFVGAILVWAILVESAVLASRGQW